MWLLIHVGINAIPFEWKGDPGHIDMVKKSLSDPTSNRH